MSIENPRLRAYGFLAEMQEDAYFPGDLVAKGQEILKRLCEDIEQQKPGSLPELYALTHGATERFNDLAEELEARGSELETAARENIGNDFATIAAAYGFEADVEELIAPRDW
ncbi:DUF5713 family protein [Sorangium sp. So ce1667]